MTTNSRRGIERETIMIFVRSRVVSLFRFEFSSIEIRESIIGTSREESARGMSESKTERERKAGGKNVCARICGERSAKGARKGGRERA